MKIIIIEDEKIIANDIVNCLRDLRPTFTIVKVLSSVKSAVEYLKCNHKVDLIFSDIQLGDGLSFEIFRETNIKVPVIFCTAYSEYAFQAINANGIAFLLKPFSVADIQMAIEKFEVFTKMKKLNIN